MRFLLYCAIVFLLTGTPQLRKQLGNWTGTVVPMANQPELGLYRVVRALNGQLEPRPVIGEETARNDRKRRKQTPRLLRRMVELWRSSGPKLTKLARSHRKLFKQLDGYWQTMPKSIVSAPFGGAAIALGEANDDPGPREEAFNIFIRFLLNPACSRLAGPCDRCGDYYIRKSAHNKRYCSRSCGTRATAIAATKKRRQEERRDKLRRASHWIEQWHKATTKLDWKRWVSNKAPDIKSNFLSRAVNRGDLLTPVRGVSRRNHHVALSSQGK